ncbi:unnamed protein product [Heligmosomoides polygyrus]|uniref:Uncharacterized protein n=1 Tax=Heligmosomoides polygyrus TaxID=6339 RepID=A0A3P8CH87_HELPZ|nr:unnamed protein product [Heligmosomoides polygyrus]
MFGGGLRGLVAAAKAAGGVNHMTTPQVDETSQLIANHTPHANKTAATRPYTLYTQLEETPKSNKSSEDGGGETPTRYSPPQDVPKPTTGRRLSDMFSRIRRGAGAVTHDPPQTEQLLPSQRSRTPSPRYSSVHGRNVSPPSPAERYPPRFRSNSPPSSSDYAMSVRDPALRRPRPAHLYYARPLRTGYPPYPQQYARSPYSDDSMTSSYRRHGYSRYHDSTPPEISEDDETMPNAVRQRRLPLIASIPPVGGSDMRSNPYPQPSYTGFPPSASHSSIGQFATPPYRPPSVVSPIRPHHQDYYTPRDNYYDIPSPSPAGNDMYHGYNRSSPSRYPSVVYAHDNGPRTRIIQAQSGAIPLSDSESDDQERWAVV